MKQKTLLELFVLIILVLICILNPIYNNIHNVNIYKKPILGRLSDICKALQKYNSKHNKLPRNLKDLLHEHPQILSNIALSAKVNDDRTHQNYYSPFLYDEKLKETYKKKTQNTIIVASPRYRNKRYILLLETIVKPKWDHNKRPIITIKTMDEDDFQRQAKIQGWIIPEQKFDPEKVEKQRIEKLKQKQKELTRRNAG
jgi:hypothetical protein